MPLSVRPGGANADGTAVDGTRQSTLEVHETMQLRLGEVLVQRGILSATQVDQALEEQRRSGRPFGVLCEQMFGVQPDTIEDAWAEQYAGLTRKINPEIESFEERALALVTRRQAWQFRVLPIRFDGEELMLATTSSQLRRALRFASRVIGVPAWLVIAEPEALGRVLCKRFPLAGLTPRSIDDHALDKLLTMAKTSAA